MVELKKDLERAKMATIVAERRPKASPAKKTPANGRAGATGPNAQNHVRAECNHVNASATSTTAAPAKEANQEAATRIAVLVWKTVSLTSHWCLN